jgi:quercetin dioxygenase-like cupin family protein
MTELEAKSFDSPEETRTFTDGAGVAKIVDIGDYKVGLIRYEPGWRWSTHVKPLAGTDSCQAHHTGVFLKGRMVVRMNDGSEHEYGPGDAFLIPPGHDAWIVGDEACEAIDWTGMKTFAVHE